MTIKESMNKEVEIDIGKWIKNTWNGIINLCNKLPKSINPEFRKHKAWPDENIYRVKQADSHKRYLKE